jgi:hypothetical protein
MNDYWSVDRDILVHERRGPPIRYLAAIVGLVFFLCMYSPRGTPQIRVILKRAERLG